MTRVETQLVHELLEAHDDTARLAADLALDWRWQVHLGYLRDLQRLGRQELARASCWRARRFNRPRRSPPNALRPPARRCECRGLGKGPS
jgi:hypothetical protein